jgi:hypothetical protein
VKSIDGQRAWNDSGQQTKNDEAPPRVALVTPENNYDAQQSEDERRGEQATRRPGYVMTRIYIARREEPRKTKILKISRDKSEDDSLKGFLSTHIRECPKSRSERSRMSEIEYRKGDQSEAVTDPDFNDIK